MKIMRLDVHLEARAKLVDLIHYGDDELDAAAEVLAKSPHLHDRDMAQKWIQMRAREIAKAERAQ